MTKLTMRAGCAILCTVLLAGCPELLSGAVLHGYYAGSWSVPAEGDVAPEACPISLELEHYPFTKDIEDATELTGYVNLDFTCFEMLQTVMAFQGIEVGEIPVVGRVIPGGGFLLRSEDLIGGCNGDICISLVMTGQAVDVDGDGMADALAGEWNALFPFPMSGTFTAQREEME